MKPLNIYSYVFESERRIINLFKIQICLKHLVSFFAHYTPHLLV